MKKIKENGFPDFLNSGFIEFNGAGMAIDSKLTALRYGLKNYYETYGIWHSNFYEYFHKGHSNIILSQAKGNEYLIKYFASISFIHLSFEHFIFEVLGNKSSILSKLTLDKQSNIVEILTGDIYSKDFSEKNNIDYSIALSRVEELIKNDSKLTADFKIDTKYHFISKHIKTLNQLRILRNNIIHSGELILNKYTYEYFFVNQLLPLIREYLNTQIQSNYLERNLHCEKNVIDEIISTPLTENYDDFKIFEELSKKLRRINHFKELGRASFSNPIHMLENVTSEEHKKSLEENVNKRKREEASLHVHFRQEVLGHFEVHICPCCGTNSLTTFDYWTVSVNQRTRVETAECSVCTYKVGINIGEPKEFGIMKTELFIYLD